MALFRKLMINEKNGWRLMNPKNPMEALIVAWYLFKYPDRVGALIGVEQEFMLAKRKQERHKENESGIAFCKSVIE